MYNRFDDGRDKLLKTSQVDRAMKPEQFDQVIAAILSGKYSWACVLILKFGGYNPLHYIPYRPYNRIIKDNNCRVSKKSSQKQESRFESFDDFNYLEDLSESQTRVSGGSGRLGDYWSRDWFR
jgi:hypothetical protein